MKQKIIIFEGPDMSGKSTIAKALSEKIGIPMFKMQLPKHFWDFLCHQRYAMEAMTQMLEQTGVSVIFDRLFPSEWMFSKLFNRDYLFEKSKETDTRFAKMGAIIIYCYKEKSKYQEDPEDKDYISSKDYDKMKKLYWEYFDSTKCQVFSIDTSNENLEEQLALIVENI